MHFIRKNEINKNLSIFEDTLGGSERLLSSPVPLFYSRHTARFLGTWLALLPLGLYSQFGNSWNHCMMIPATAFISVCLFGIEELATQLEEPFTILPMQGFCDKIGINCDEIVSWAGHVQDDERALAAEARALAAEARALAVERGYEQVSKLQKENRIKRRDSMRERLSPIEGQVQITVS
jgi:predicted membrane chloride channel (bestrophin family)